MNHPSRLRIAALTLFSWLFFAALCGAAEAKRRFDLAAGDAAQTLTRFAEQADREIVFSPAAVRGTKTKTVTGEFSAREALDLMLDGTGLVATQDEATRTFAVRLEKKLPKEERTAPNTPSDRPAKPETKRDETIVLNPFEVQTFRDTSYGALNSNSITRFNTELNKVPISADIFTEDFMMDVDLTTVNDMLSQYGAGIGTIETAGVTQIGVRGLGAGSILRNGFNVLPENGVNAGGNPWQNNFDIERVEVLRGPQGLLYGAGGAGGTIVATTKQAKFNRNSGSLIERIDQYGSKRTTLDVNQGNDAMAAHFSLLHQTDQTRRLFNFTKDRGYYGELAFRLPLHTTLKFNGEYLVDDRNAPTSSPNVNLGSSDPRNGDLAMALFFNHDAGAINPATGQPWSSIGAIDNGHLSWENLYSFNGYRNESVTKSIFCEAIADTVWTNWLSTEVGVNYNNEQNTIDQGVSALTAPLVNGNPLNAWAMNSNMNDANNFNRYKQLRLAALVSKDFFYGRIKTQTAGGFDKEQQGFGTQAFSYYQADSSGNLIISPTSKLNLGRTAASGQWWSIDNGPVFHPAGLPPMATPLWYSAQDGKYYARQERNPRNPAWVTPTNPEGLASLYFPANAQVAANNDLPNYENEYNVTGAYFANSTSWFGDLFNTLVGFRRTKTANHVPNVSSLTATEGFNTAIRTSNSYNVGLDGRITPWLRWYVSASANYNNPVTATPPAGDDPYGNPPLNSRGLGREFGLKFTPLEGRISGSLSYYRNQSKDDASNQTAPLASINPTGLNGQYPGAFGAGSAVPVDYLSDGFELIMTTNITPNWRLRFAATTQNGRVASSKSYDILYNDQFYTDGKGGVTYADKSPFLVPVTPGTNVSSLSTTATPDQMAQILSGPTTQLTTAMIGDSTSPWYAWQGNQVSVVGNIAPNSFVGRALKNFNKPNVGSALTGVTGLPLAKNIQYAWPDPNNNHGTILVTQAGQDTVGYPRYRLSLTNAYEFASGWLRGFGTVLSLNNAWQYRTLYYNSPDGILRLWSEPELGWQINLSPYYKHRFRRVVWRTQLNITNLTNHYLLAQTPNNGSGFTKPLTLAVRWEGVPRFYAWSNTFSF